MITKLCCFVIICFQLYLHSDQHLIGNIDINPAGLISNISDLASDVPELISVLAKDLQYTSLNLNTTSNGTNVNATVAGVNGTIAAAPSGLSGTVGGDCPVVGVVGAETSPGNIGAVNLANTQLGTVNASAPSQSSQGGGSVEGYNIGSGAITLP